MANKLSQWSLTLLRLILGIMFTYHGYTKLFVVGGLPGTAQFFQIVGIPLAKYAAVFVSFLEFIGGLLLLARLFTKVVVSILIIEMLVAFFKVHLKNGFFIAPQSYGYEYVMLILASLAILLVNGPGNLAIGRMIKGKDLE